MTVGELMEKLGGTLVEGDKDWNLDGIGAPTQAGIFDLAFADTEGPAVEALGGKAGAVVLKPGLAAAYPHGKTIIEADQPRLWFAKAARLILGPPPTTGKHLTAIAASDTMLGIGSSLGPNVVIEGHVVIGENTRIEAGCVVGHNVQIGSNCHFHPRVVIYPNTTIGDRVVVHAGAVLGADGFGYVRDPATGAYTQFPQRGKLVIEDDVEIGANSTIDRGALEETRIGRGTKIDNLVHVGHNCDIGEDVILVALTGISGSSSIGDGTVLAGQVGIGDHVHVGPGLVIGGQSGVFNGKTLEGRPGEVFYGTPARPVRQTLREQATLARLARKNSAGN